MTDDEPLSAPLYGAAFAIALKRFWSKYATFTGRASRSEWWWAALAYFVVAGVFEILLSVSGSASKSIGPDGIPTYGLGFWVVDTVWFLWVAATLIPGLALFSRRLHDSNLSAWFLLLVLVPFAGWIALLVLAALDSKPDGQRFEKRTQ
jgi:uncharacterized membrane protein YhaH (DUF805 family)